MGVDGSEPSSMLAFTLNEIRAAWLGRGPPGPCSIKAGIGHQIIVKYIVSLPWVMGLLLQGMT